MPVIPTYFPPCSEFSALYKMNRQQPLETDFIKTLQKIFSTLQLLFAVHFINTWYLEEGWPLYDSTVIRKMAAWTCRSSKTKPHIQETEMLFYFVSKARRSSYEYWISYTQVRHSNTFSILRPVSAGTML